MISHNTSKHFVLAAGGTGGHFFPALSLAKELQKRGHDVQIMTDMRARKYGEQLDGLDIKENKSATIFAGGIVGRLMAPFKIGLGVLQAGVSYILKRPDAVIGFGGYPSFAPLFAARLIGIPIAIHEQNAVLGRANRVLSSFGAKIATSYAGTKRISVNKRGDSVVTGNPLRDQVLLAAAQPYQSPSKTGQFNLLVFGGSQGASVFSEILPKAIAALSKERRNRIRLIQQCRTAELKDCLKIYGDMGLNVELRDFFDDMPQRIADSHLVIGRSGASTVCELAAIGRPSILVPFPGALDNDQMMNAVHLSNYNAALLIEQRLFSMDKLTNLLTELMDNPEELERMAQIARGRGKLDAVLKLADFSEERAGLTTDKKFEESAL